MINKLTPEPTRRINQLFQLVLFRKIAEHCWQCDYYVTNRIYNPSDTIQLEEMGLIVRWMQSSPNPPCPHRDRDVSGSDWPEKAVEIYRIGHSYQHHQPIYKYQKHLSLGTHGIPYICRTIGNSTMEQNNVFNIIKYFKANWTIYPNIIQGIREITIGSERCWLPSSWCNLVDTLTTNDWIMIN